MATTDTVAGSEADSGPDPATLTLGDAIRESIQRTLASTPVYSAVRVRDPAAGWELEETTSRRETWRPRGESDPTDRVQLVAAGRLPVAGWHVIHQTPDGRSRRQTAEPLLQADAVEVAEKLMVEVADETSRNNREVSDRVA